jgi:CheY-like chemotaxis protein
VSSPDGRTAGRVLIIDDDEEIRHVLRLVFEIDGFEVVGEAADGAEGVAMVLSRSPDVIVVDYLMPRMNGAKTAEFVRAMAPETRIVAFSAHLEGRPQWADAFLNKARIAEIAPLLHSLIRETSPTEGRLAAE